MSDHGELRERVARAIWGARFSSSLTDPADAALAALGLDDLDAAVERGARRLVWEQHQGCVQWDDDPTDTTTSGDGMTRGYALSNARAVLEAALTPPENSDDLPPCTCTYGNGRRTTVISDPNACPRHVVDVRPDTSSP